MAAAVALPTGARLVALRRRRLRALLTSDDGLRLLTSGLAVASMVGVALVRGALRADDPAATPLADAGPYAGAPADVASVVLGLVYAGALAVLAESSLSVSVFHGARDVPSRSGLAREDDAHHCMQYAQLMRLLQYACVCLAAALGSFLFFNGVSEVDVSPAVDLGDGGWLEPRQPWLAGLVIGAKTALFGGVLVVMKVLRVAVVGPSLRRFVCSSLVPLSALATALVAWLAVFGATSVANSELALAVLAIAGLGALAWARWRSDPLRVSGRPWAARGSFADVRPSDVT